MLLVTLCEHLAEDGGEVEERGDVIEPKALLCCCSSSSGSWSWIDPTLKPRSLILIFRNSSSLVERLKIQLFEFLGSLSSNWSGIS